MNKKELLTPFIIAALSLLFVAICFMVILTKGKSKLWLAHKLKIGGILLSLSIWSCTGGHGRVTCYDVAAPNSMWINPNSKDGIEIKLDTGNILYGSIVSIQGKDFSFLVTDSTLAKFQRGIISVDEKPENYSKSLKIELDKNIKPGTYILKLFTAKPESQDTIRANREFKLIIKNE